MKSILTFLFLVVSFITFSQVSVDTSSEFKNGEEFVVFDFKNTTNQYISVNVIITYTYTNGDYTFLKKKKFDLNFLPNELLQGNLQYTTSDNNFILKKKDGNLILKNFNVVFE